MHVELGNGQTEHGPGVDITLTGDEVALAIASWLHAHGVYIQVARTITVNGEKIKKGRVYVDPSGSVITGGERLLGSGK